MALTGAQKQTIATHLQNNTDPVVVQAKAEGNTQTLVTWYNAMTAAYFVWRTSITLDEINDVVDWDEVVALTTNKMIAFQLLKGQSMINASKASIRQAFNSIFPSNQSPNTNAALIAVAKRLATQTESLLATGTGTQAVPATMTFEGNVTIDEMRDIILLLP